MAGSRRQIMEKESKKVLSDRLKRKKKVKDFLSKPVNLQVQETYYNIMNYADDFYFRGENE